MSGEGITLRGAIPLRVNLAKYINITNTVSLHLSTLPLPGIYPETKVPTCEMMPVQGIQSGMITAKDRSMVKIIMAHS